MEETVIIETEKQEVKEYAGFWLRLAANILDGIIISTPITFLFAFIMTGDIFAVSNIDDPMPAHETLANITFAIYGLLLPIFWGGFTIGKKVMNVKIVRVDGKPLTFGTMLMRNFVAGFVYVLTLGIGIIVSAFMVGLREDKRSIHDFIAGTKVVKEKK